MGIPIWFYVFAGFFVFVGVITGLACIAASSPPPPKPKGKTTIHPFIRDIEAKGHQVQVIDRDTGEVFEPAPKKDSL